MSGPVASSDAPLAAPAQPDEPERPTVEVTPSSGAQVGGVPFEESLV